MAAARTQGGLAVLALALLAAATTASSDKQAETAVDVVRQVFGECVLSGSFACVRPRMLAFLAEAKRSGDGVIRITRDLAVVPAGEANGLQDADDEEDADDAQEKGDVAPRSLLERVAAMERFLRGHAVRVAVPRELVEAVPHAARAALPAELRLPLDPERGDAVDAATGRHRRRRNFLKKVVLPFILGLKFKTTVLVPLALSLIALKTWKALTLGLLSLVLSGAMVIFRFTKPKVVNYDVYHYPQSHYEHHVDHHHHGYDHHHGHLEHYAAARADDMAYSAHHDENHPENKL